MDPGEKARWTVPKDKPKSWDRMMGSESEWNSSALIGSMTPSEAGSGGDPLLRAAAGGVLESAVGVCFLGEGRQRCPLTGTSQVGVGGMGLVEKVRQCPLREQGSECARAGAGGLSFHS